MLNKTKSVLEVNIHDTNIFVGEFSIFKSCDDYLKLSSYVTHRSKALLGVKQYLVFLTVGGKEGGEGASKEFENCTSEGYWSIIIDQYGITL